MFKTDRRCTGAGFALCLMLLMFTACAQEPEASPREQLEQRMQTGDAAAMFALAEDLCCGLGADKNEERAFVLYCQAARQGHAEAQFALGRMYQEQGLPIAAQSRYAGVSVKKDNTTALAWYLHAYKNGAALAGRYLQLLSETMNTTQKEQAIGLAEEVKAIPCAYMGQHLQ